jgi:hypothetical protein
VGKRRRLLNEYQFPRYRPRVDIQGVFGDPRAQVIQLGQTQKKVCSCFNMIYRVYYDKKVWPIRDLSRGDIKKSFVYAVKYTIMGSIWFCLILFVAHHIANLRG